jgi:predicted anti-sigma-YlaC factor YlaD
VRCDDVRVAISARLDGERPTANDAAIEAHIARCADCRAFEREARQLSGPPVRGLTTDSDGLVQRVMHALEPDRSTSRQARALRISLVVIGIVQFAAAVPLLLGHDTDGLSEHATRHLGSYSAAIAAGFIYTALRPRRIGGFLPVVAVLAGCLVVTGVIDIADGHTGAVAESSHLIEVLGLIILGLITHLERPRRAPSDPPLRAVDDLSRAARE